LLYLLALQIRPGAHLPPGRPGSYVQFVAPGVIGMSVLPRRSHHWHRPALGPPVRLSEGTRRAGAAAAHHDRKNPSKNTMAILEGLLIVIVCLIAGFQPAHLSTLRRADVQSNAIVFAARNPD
jgi:ABC-2 type transport system permease protein